MMETPLALSSPMMLKSTSTSLLLRAAVGSSMIRMETSSTRALAISTICCWPTFRSRTKVRGEMSWLSRRMSSAARRSWKAWSIQPGCLSRSRLANRFSATERFGNRFISW